MHCFSTIHPANETIDREGLRKPGCLLQHLVDNNPCLSAEALPGHCVRQARHPDRKRERPHAVWACLRVPALLLVNVETDIYIAHLLIALGGRDDRCLAARAPPELSV